MLGSSAIRLFKLTLPLRKRRVRGGSGSPPRASGGELYELQRRRRGARAEQWGGGGFSSHLKGATE
eukprot:1701-Alexandrium_andersonii.AAC.1